jgi:hypothetical protein
MWSERAADLNCGSALACQSVGTEASWDAAPWPILINCTLTLDSTENVHSMMPPIFHSDVIRLLCVPQADVCHAYQILKKGGLKDENIIVFMYDDIAYDSENPYPGTIINNPLGSDVYHGVPKV